MGDTDAPTLENQTQEPNAKYEEAKPSMDILKEAKPSENIAINKNEKIKIVSEEQSVSSSDTVESGKEQKSVEDEDAANKATLKNRSDIFSLNENKTVPCTIFSVNGAPSKVIHKTISINSTDTSGSGGSKLSQFRNPVTGIGVSSNDEFKNKPSKRKDGNPLLGVGYKDDEDFNNPPTSRRIPPGGYSKGLW